MAKVNVFLAKIITGAIHGYRWLISPLLGNCCRFYPSCSQYAMEAIEKHGVGYGCILTIKRLVKCHPYHEGGIDMVPTSTRE